MTWCDWKALGVVERSNKVGLEAWRPLKLDCDAHVVQRCCDSSSTASDKERRVDCFQSFTAWEAIVSEYISQSGEPLSDKIRVSVLLEHGTRTVSSGPPPRT